MTYRTVLGMICRVLRKIHVQGLFLLAASLALPLGAQVPELPGALPGPGSGRIISWLDTQCRFPKGLTFISRTQSVQAGKDAPPVFAAETQVELDPEGRILRGSTRSVQGGPWTVSTWNYEGPGQTSGFVTVDAAGLAVSRTVYAYDEAARLVEARELDPAGTLSSASAWKYDDSGAVTEFIQELWFFVQADEEDSDQADIGTDQEAPAGHALVHKTWTYDSHGWLAVCMDWDDQDRPVLRRSYSHDTQGRIVQVEVQMQDGSTGTWVDDQTEVWRYGPDGRLAEVRGQTAEGQTVLNRYTWTAKGFLASWETLGDGGVVLAREEYRYDARGLIQEIRTFDPDAPSADSSRSQPVWYIQRFSYAR